MSRGVLPYKSEGGARRKISRTPLKGYQDLVLSEAAQTHYMNADVTLACERRCVTNGYLQRLVWDVNGFS